MVCSPVESIKLDRRLVNDNLVNSPLKFMKVSNDCKKLAVVFGLIIRKRAFNSYHFRP